MTHNDLTQGSILSHIKTIAIPASIGMLFNTLFNVVDTFYAGKLSTDALAGLTISFPIFFIIIALSSGVGSGTTALCSIALGRKSMREFYKLSYNAILSSIAIGLIIMISAPFVTPFLFRVSGASGNAMDLGIGYTKIIFYGSIFFVLNSTLNGILNAQGDTKSFRNFLILGFFLNLFLDPLFIFGWFGLPELGTLGVALATVIVQAIGTVYMTFRVLKRSIFDLKEFLGAHFSLETSGHLFKQGAPASLNMATIAIGVFVINYFILYYAGSATDSSTIAAFGAAVRVEQLALLPALGLNIATLTITGQNYGANQYHRIYEVKKKTIQIGVGMMLIGAIIIYPLAPYLIGLFNSDPAVIAAGTVYLRIEVFAFPTYIILNIITSVFQGIKKPNFAVYIGLYRQIILPIILFYVLGTYLNLGIRGVWWGIVLINWSAVLIAVFYDRYLLKKTIPLT